MVYQCLIDKKRTVFFEKVIQNTVKENDVVVDLGTGTGIMSLIACKAGAKKVYAVEADRDLCKTLEMTIVLNKLQDKMFLIEGDATAVELPEKVDVVICEMIATGLIDELQIPVMNNILQYCSPNTKIIPTSMSNYVDLVDADENYYGHRIKAVQYEYGYCDESGRREPVAMTEKHMYKTVDFTQKTSDTTVSGRIVLEIVKDGSINGMRISNSSMFPDGSSIMETPAYCMPLIMPIGDIEVSAGDKVEVSLNYDMCNGLHNMQFEIAKLS